eukprot:4405210-Pyramimonas_sp.AAC.1
MRVGRVFVRRTGADNARARSCRTVHHAKRVATWRASIFKTGLATVRSDLDQSWISTKALLHTTPNLRVPAAAEARRTFNLEAAEAMYQACRHDARWSLPMTILTEIGLRATSLCHVKYSMLVDSTHTPRCVCRVPEKANTCRCSATSARLKKPVKRYAEPLRDLIDSRGGLDSYIFNPKHPEEPLKDAAWRAQLQSFARSAGATEIKVHPYMLRHTIVGRLVDAGNSMELVSKYMGHANLHITAGNYW